MPKKIKKKIITNSMNTTTHVLMMLYLNKKK
jgi:hypothetical protein